jgi:ADP-heptose:LPS heptosyltransferase
MGIVDLSGELKTWDDTAAVMSSLDAVVSVDSGPAQVNGALNVPTWALLPAAADWRWGLDVTTP